MPNRAEIDVQRIYDGLNEKLNSDFLRITSQIPHSGVKGSERERVLIEFLEIYLPKKYSVTSGHIINQDNLSSKQCDIIIYDSFVCPPLYSSKGYQIVPHTAVVAVIEVKSILYKTSIYDAVENIEAAKKLRGGKNISGYVFGYSAIYKSDAILKVAENLFEAEKNIAPECRIDYVHTMNDGAIIHEGGGESYFVVTDFEVSPLIYFLDKLICDISKHDSYFPGLVRYAGLIEIGLVTRIMFENRS